MMKRFSLLIVAIVVALLSFRYPALAQESPDMGMSQGGGDQIQQPNENGDAQASPDNPGDENADQDQNQDQNQRQDSGDDNGDQVDTGDSGAD